MFTHQCMMVKCGYFLERNQRYGHQEHGDCRRYVNVNTINCIVILVFLESFCFTQKRFVIVYLVGALSGRPQRTTTLLCSELHCDAQLMMYD